MDTPAREEVFEGSGLAVPNGRYQIVITLDEEVPFTSHQHVLALTVIPAQDMANFDSVSNLLAGPNIVNEGKVQPLYQYIGVGDWLSATRWAETHKDAYLPELLERGLPPDRYKVTAAFLGYDAEGLFGVIGEDWDEYVRVSGRSSESNLRFWSLVGQAQPAAPWKSALDELHEALRDDDSDAKSP